MAALDTPEAMTLRRLNVGHRDQIIGFFWAGVLDYARTILPEDKVGALRAEGSKTAIVPFFRYPMSAMLHALDECGKASPDYGMAVGNAGLHVLTGLLASPIGNALVRLAQRKPHDLFAATPAGYRACNFYGEREYVKEAENAALVIFRRELMGPAWQVRIYPRALKSICGVDATCEVLDADEALLNFTVRTTW